MTRIAPLAVLLATTALSTALFTPALADTTLATDNGVILDNLCVGRDCTNPETFWGFSEIVIKDLNTRLRFDDTSSPTGNYPDTDWALQANDTISNGADEFMLQDLTAGTTPLAVSGGAPSNALFVAADGKIGLGTSLPQANLHILDATHTATLRLEETAGTPYAWDIRGNNNALYVYDPQTYNIPFKIRSGAPNNSFIIRNTGAIGLGISSPQAALHLQRADGTAQVLIEETSATSNPRTLLNLQNNGRPEIVMGNTATNGEWSFGAGTNFFLKVGAVGSTSGAKTKVFTVKNTGDVIVKGTLTTGGTTCGGGCDAVFSDDYDLPSIADHAAQMKALGYLPNVGPTLEGAPVNVTDKLGRVLNELEHAHLYIAELETRLSDQQAQIERLTQQPSDARIATLEARLAALSAELAQLH